jgi:ParB family chromosome partitioning protein
MDRAAHHQESVNLMGNGNHIEFDWAVDAIVVGARHRKDLGDLTSLVESIDTHGLMQLITITPDGVLVCGARRLAAVKRLGWRTVHVWVRTGLSDRLAALMAERDENVSHKEYTKGELADLYAELKAEIAADAARRQQATQFGAGEHNPRWHGVGNLPTPSGEATGDSRHQAARMVGAGGGYKTLEKILKLRDIAANISLPATIREQAALAVAEIDAGAPVDGWFHKVSCLVAADDLEQTAVDDSEPVEVREEAERGLVMLRKLEAAEKMSAADLDRTAQEALQRVETARSGIQHRSQASCRRPGRKPARRLRSVKEFTWMWTEIADWPARFDPEAVAARLTVEQWTRFQQTMRAGQAFLDQVAQVRADLGLDT